MLARGVLCRLAADVPNTSTHDLPRISHLLRTNLAARNGAPLPAAGAIARAFAAAALHGRRAYATKTATKPTATVKRVVKKPVVAKKPVRKTAVKKPAAKKAAATKPKRKVAAKKKPAPKKKPVARAKKVLTPEQKEQATIRELKKRALVAPKTPRATAWLAFVGESNKKAQSLEDAQRLIKEASVKYKTLTPAEREHYNQLANEQLATSVAEYKKWLHQYTPEEIRAANRARNALKRKLGDKVTRRSVTKLADDRVSTLRAPPSAYILYCKERHASGDFKGVTAPESTKLIASEWRALGVSEKQKYKDEYAAALAKRTA